MKKSLLSLVMLLFVMGVALAQRTITGTVTDTNGEPLIGANVTGKGVSNVGTVTDIDGNFSLKIPTSVSTLIVSYTGYTTIEQAIGNESVLTIQMTEDSKALGEVVVTALGIKRSEKSLTYSAQSVKDEQLNTIRQTNLNNALAGKVAGIQVRSQSAVALGRDASIRIRGAGSLSDKAPLYILDGNPVGSADVNLDDVESVTVLKGPSATALYGQRGDAGVIVITSKKGASKKGIGIELNQSTFWDNVYILPKYQNSYAGGASGDLIKFTYEAGMPEEWKALDGKYYHDYSDDSSWGPRMVGQQHIPWYAWYPGTQYTGKTEALLPQPNNIRNFFQSQVATNTNVNFTKAGEGYSTRLSFTAQNQNGMLYNSRGDKYTISSNSTVDLGKHFTAGANLNFVDYTIKGQFDDAYSNQSTGSFNSWFHRDLDLFKLQELKDLKSPEGILASWNHNNPGAYNSSPLDFYGANYWYNFYSWFDNINYTENRRRFFGDVNLTYKLNENFKIASFVRLNNGNSFGENSIPSILQNSATQTGIKAAYGTFQYYGNFINNQWRPNETNYELMAIYNKRIADKFTVDLIAGGNLRQDRYRIFYASTVDGLTAPDLFTLSNSLTPSSPGSYRAQKEVRSMYARASFGFNDFVYLEGSVRNDRSSALPVGANSYTYPSVGASFIFSELLQEAIPSLSYGKLRASWAQVGSDLDPYLLALNYSFGANKFDGNAVMGTPNTIVDPNIKPALSSSYEFGGDIKFFHDRLGLSATYYNEDKIDEIINVPISGASGFTSKLINAGKLNRNGIELSLNIVPVKSKNFTWESFINYARNRSKIVELAEGIDAIVVNTTSNILFNPSNTNQGGSTFSTSSGATIVHQVGQPWGQIRGGAFTMLNGQRVVDANGLYVQNPNQYLGSVLPKFTGGWTNTFTYKSLVFNANIEFSKGGKYFSLSDHWGSFSGLFARTADLNDKGNPKRDPVADGGGVHVTGVTAEGKPVDTYVDAQTYYHQFRGRNITEEHVYDLDFIKLRELSLGYKIPLGGMNKYVQTATISLVARNPWLIYAKNRDFDPSEMSSIFGENGQFPGTRSFGFNLKLGF